MLLLVFIVGSVLFGGKALTDDVPTSAIHFVQQSVVPILLVRVKGDVREIKAVMGTGFFINREGQFATALHVLDKLKLQEAKCAEASELCVWAIFVPVAKWESRPNETGVKLFGFRFTDCRSNSKSDVAVCTTVENPFSDAVVKTNVQPASLGVFENYPDCSPLAFTGFPLESRVPITSKGYLAGFFRDSNHFAIDKDGWPGASGAPVYDTRGRVIGFLVKGGRDEGTGFAIACPISSLLELLNENRISQ